MIYKQTKQVEFETGSFFCDPKTNQPIKAEQCIFLDIETVPGFSSYEELSESLQKRWDEKVDKWIKYSESSKAKILDAVFSQFEKQEKSYMADDILFDIYQHNMLSRPKDLYFEMAGLYPEYGKVICISIGSIKDGKFNVITFVGEEKQLLSDFLYGIMMTYKRLSMMYSDIWVVGHNVSFFDIPYITKRMNLHGLLVPHFLHKAFQQPWNKKIVDTATEWRVGNTTGDATLETIAISLKIESSKNHKVNGESMAKYYYSPESNIEEIAEYCEDDVRCQYELFTHLQNLKTVKL